MIILIEGLNDSPRERVGGEVGQPLPRPSVRNKTRCDIIRVRLDNVFYKI